ncbi:PhnD/SsuA/transferrin family substrate-binding protein [Waterburya agarophytonicola K14]|uniref:PhnD/SsuA/transferrin family substrate-binding protein n=1 Tax=Waterburya agarophytonicola KI4 TaxID=2874699 RepID=A0A964BSQ8_9CYAN|nr:PhnD/SsuA/transferrin family substrate-binding protein [Waterburya agarophytonicola]MCC0177496.1 PhnD/SsuA/transferrin family substrate-binding protein [Waterburya agarophytonicola KI4]
MSFKNLQPKFYQATKILLSKTRSQILLISCGSLILPALLAPLAPISIKQLLFTNSISAVAQAQQSSTVNSTKTILKIGVLAKRGPEKVLSQWQPLAEYLSKNIPEYSFQIVPLNFEEIYQETEAKSIDFIIANSGMYVDFEAEYGANRIATLKNLRLGKPYTSFGGVILVRADRQDINTLKDLKGKTFMAVNQTSLGGWQMAWGVLKQQGIKPEKHFKELSFGDTHDAVVEAVLEGKVDAGTVRTDTLERMAAEGKIKLEDFRIINQQQDPSGQFPFVHSTPLYPEWPFAVAKGVPIEISEKVSAALLSMPKDSPAAIAAKSEGWTIPLNYRPVHELFLDLQIGPYEELGVITVSQLLRRFWYIPTLTFIGLVGTILYFQQRTLAQRQKSEAALAELNISLEESNKSLEVKAEEQRQEKEKLEEAIYTLLDEVSDATDGDLTVRANLDSLELSTVADLFNAIISSLQEIAIEAKQSSGQVGSSLKQSEVEILALAEQAIVEAQETRNTLISVEQMSQSIQVVAKNANRAEQIANDTYITAVESSSNMDLTVNSILNLRTTVKETANKMKRLGESSLQISQIVSFIEEIALKTNVLAINASAEADRAGEYGQGFIIIAEQVGTLAKQSTSAIQQIANIATTIQHETQEVSNVMESGNTEVVESARLVKASKESLNKVLEKSQAINQLMESISKATISQANTSQDVSNLMQKIASLSENTSESSKKVAQSIVATAEVAQKLESTVAQFKVAE